MIEKLEQKFILKHAFLASTVLFSTLLFGCGNNSSQNTKLLPPAASQINRVASKRESSSEELTQKLDLIVEGRSVAYPNSLDWIKYNSFSWNQELPDATNVANIKNLITSFQTNILTSTAEITDEDIAGRSDYRNRVMNYLYSHNENQGYNKKAVIVLGLPASGKSTVSTPLTSQELSLGSLNIDPMHQGSYLLVDPDEVKSFLPEYDNGLLADVVHQESSLVAKAILAKGIQEGANICLPTLGNGQSYNLDFYNKKIKALADKDYDITVVYADIPVQAAKERNLKRLKRTGRYVADSYLDSIGNSIGNNFCTLINDTAQNQNVSKFIWLDNSGASAKEILSGTPSNKSEVAELNRLAAMHGYVNKLAA